MGDHNCVEEKNYINLKTWETQCRRCGKVTKKGEEYGKDSSSD